ncbi:MAG: imidazole glycerol phosphate synthase cyclase subunit [Rhodopirellula sp.]|nr:imidazole glycerol phosphate synthase cyclase subunit [Rhodopirellula sp.]
MHKKRLIFTLLFKDNSFYLSRNFRLQKIGNINWLSKNYNFSTIGSSIDELIILNVGVEQDLEEFIDAVNEISKHCFAPIALGGGIRSLKDAEYLFSNGADKIVINSILETDQRLVSDIISKYGSQSVIASIDYKVNDKKSEVPFIFNGKRAVDYLLKDYMHKIISMNVGEIYLNSIDRDGTGNGYDFDTVENLITDVEIPVILAGGAGNPNHLLEGLSKANIDAASTANLLNFVGDGLPKARNYLLEMDVPLADWRDDADV